MAAASGSWAQVASLRGRGSTPFKETYQRKVSMTQLRSHIRMLEGLVADLQQNNCQLSEVNKDLLERVGRLEKSAESIAKSVDRKEIVQEVIQECIVHPNPRLMQVIEKAVERVEHQEGNGKGRIVVEASFHKKVQSSLIEEKDRVARETNLRIGGLKKEILEGWFKDENPRQKMLEHMYFRYQIDIRGPLSIQAAGSQVVVTCESKEVRNQNLKSAYKLKGSPTWMAEDLTRWQLSQKKTELEKVRKARGEGLWAKYMDGVAVIRDFKKRAVA